MDEYTPLAGLQTPLDYRTAGRTHIFPSDPSFEWFCRKHKTELVRAGALTKPNGKWLVDPPRMDEAALELGHIAATEATTT
jgi:hypothetical protein